jgi:hypothetical protein
MTFAPRHDWKAYEALTAESDAERLRALTPEEKFAIYADMFRIAREARNGPGDWERLDRYLWEEKVAIRLRMVEAFRKMDQLDAERAASNSAG